MPPFMPKPPKPPKAPPDTASDQEHRRHAEEFLKLEEFKKKPAELNDRSDEAKD